MKHLTNAEKTIDNKYITVNGNKITFVVQDGPIGEVGENGLQAVDMLAFVRELIRSLNDDFPCRENYLTIEHIDVALRYQHERTENRIARKVEGKSLP